MSDYWNDATIESHYLNRWKSIRGWDYMDPPDWETDDDIDFEEEDDYDR